MSSNRADDARPTGSGSDVLRPNSEASPPSMERNIARLTTGSRARSGSGAGPGSGTSAKASIGGCAISAACAAAAALMGPDARLSLIGAGIGAAASGAVSDDRAPGWAGDGDGGDDDEAAGAGDDTGDDTGDDGAALAAAEGGAVTAPMVCVGRAGEASAGASMFVSVSAEVSVPTGAGSLGPEPPVVLRRVIPASLVPSTSVSSPTRATTSERLGPRLAVSRISIWRSFGTRRRRANRYAATAS